jgi:23S rRNA (adenine2503-C2)-methyltransferase
MDSAAKSERALFGMTAHELRCLVEELGERPFRAVQLRQALYKQRVTLLEEISTLPLATRERLLEAGCVVGLPELAQTAKSVDGTERYLVRLADGETVETVWMPDGDGAEAQEPDEADSSAALRNGKTKFMAGTRGY